MSQTRLSLPDARLRRDAEIAGTGAKRSRNGSDYQAAIALWTKLGDSSAAGRSYLRLGQPADSAGRLPEALSAYENALKLCDAAEELACAALAGNNGGYIAHRLGDFEKSQRMLTQAVDDYDKIGQIVFKARVLSNLGLLSWQSGDFQQAINYDDRAQEILDTRDPVANARVLNNLGLCFQSLAEYEEARSDFEKALAVFTEHHSTADAARARLNLGRTFMLLGQYPLALRTLDAALQEARSIRDKAAEADTLSNLGQTQFTSGSVPEAQAALLNALDLHRSLSDKRMEASDLHFLGEASNSRGDASSARKYLTQALEIRRAVGLRDAAADSLYALASLELKEGHDDAARELAGQALDTLESVRSQIPGASLRASFYARKHRFFDLLVDIEMSPENTGGSTEGMAAGLLAAERGRARGLMDLLAEGGISSQVPESLLARRSGVQKKIDLLALRLSTATPTQAAQLRKEIIDLTSEDDEIEAAIHQDLDGVKLAKPLESIPALQSHMPSGAALLEYHLGEERSYLWLVEPKMIRVFYLPARLVIESQCEPVLRLFPAIVERKRSPEKQREFDRALQQLSSTLLGALRVSHLSGEVVIVPDGILTRVPFAALRVASGRSLGLESDLTQAPSAAFLENAASPRPIREFPKAFLAIADPVYTVTDPRLTVNVPAPTSLPDLARLPYTRELDTVSLLIPHVRRRILRGFQATAQDLSSADPGQYALVHFSAHVLIDDRVPEVSRIALSMLSASGRPVNGFLRPYQLSQLRLNGSVVVLSACETALGRQVIGEGLAGFTTSLFTAGASQLVLTLSPVDAEGSSEFLSQTYARIFGAKPSSMVHAMTLARRALAQSERWSDPFYWASFAIYGRPADWTGR